MHSPRFPELSQPRQAMKPIEFAGRHWGMGYSRGRTNWDDRTDWGGGEATPAALGPIALPDDEARPGREALPLTAGDSVPNITVSPEPPGPTGPCGTAPPSGLLSMNSGVSLITGRKRVLMPIRMTKPANVKA